MNLLRLNWIRPAFLMGAALLTAVSLADVKIVSHITANVMNKITERDTTTYYRGDLMRMEAGDSVTLFNIATNKTTVLDTAKKTYYEVDGDQAQAAMSGANFEASAKVTPTSDKMSIAGLECTKYLADLNINMSMGGQGFTTKTESHMELWTTTHLKSTLNRKQLVNMVTQTFKGAFGPDATEKLNDEMSKIKGFPLSTKMTMTISGIPGMTGSPKVEVTNVASSVSEGPVPDSMFQVPDGYTKVDRMKRRPSGGGG